MVPCLATTWVISGRAGSGRAVPSQQSLHGEWQQEKRDGENYSSGKSCGIPASMVIVPARP